MLKRAIDLGVCIVLLPVVLVLILALSMLIALDSPGSPIFVQERIGLRGKRFQIYKFRTMVQNHSSTDERKYMQRYITGQMAEEKASLHKPTQPHHITRLGRILRRTSLDELPQLINVLKGEMSLIGPRPNVSWEVESYLSWHYERLNVLPGITGLAQVMGRSAISFDQIVRYDIMYVRQQGISLDLWIAWRTLQTVFSGRGAG